MAGDEVGEVIHSSIHQANQSRVCGDHRNIPQVAYFSCIDLHRFSTICIGSEYMKNKLVSIGKAAEMLGISIDTLRRWDVSGRLKSTRSGSRGHRYYLESDLEAFLQDVALLVRRWVTAPSTSEPPPEMYCKTRDIFQARLETFQSTLQSVLPLPMISIIAAIVGEIGNNSFDHNVGNWPDIPGIFFSHSMRSRKIVLADRGLGVLTTLRRVRKDLTCSTDALRVAFTEKISGRYPESRGNGLKFVRSIVVQYPLRLEFQTGDASLYLKQHDREVSVQPSELFIRGCLAIIGFEEGQ